MLSIWLGEKERIRNMEIEIAGDGEDRRSSDDSMT